MEMHKSLLLIAIGVFTLFATALPGENIVLFGDFEDTTDTTQKWTVYADQQHVSADDYYGSTASYTNPSSGSKSVEIKVLKEQAQNWHIQLILPDWYCQKDRLYRFSMRAAGDAPVDLSITTSPEYIYKEGCTFDIYDQYNTYSYLFSSNTTGDGKLRVTISVGSHIGTYFFDDIKIEEVQILDPENSWYNNANDRIDSLRKGDFSVTLNNKQGAVTHQNIKVELLKHDFMFGTAVTFDTTGIDESWYEEKIKEHFNAIVTENALKWVDFEPDPDVLDTTNFSAYTGFAQDNNLFLRGHVLAWGLLKHGFEDHWPIQKDGAYLVENLKKRVLRDVSLYKGLIDEYDVWNEPVHEKFMFDHTYDYFKYVHYWALMDSAFHWARSVDSTAGLFVNEYNVATGGRTETLYQIVKEMMDRGVPITGIGVQCHLEDGKVEPELIRRRLDILDKLGLTLRITEFDMGIPGKGLDATEQHQANEYGKFLRTAFSHPAVDGILLWGFSDDKHWVGPVDGKIGSGLYRTDRSEKPAADTVRKLWETEWTTKLEKEVGSTNKLDFRGFYGTYKISYEADRKLFFDTISLTKESLTGSVYLSETGGTNTTSSVAASKEILRLLPLTNENQLTIQIESRAKDRELILLNIQGKIIRSQKLSQDVFHEISTDNLAKGVYFVKLRLGSKYYLQKFIL